ncbi:hypothetical protein CLOSBL3_10826 [Clostridiaceae bacterium BL-3]|nr:hypothetical protein CLOSBL3_10826 [Clostridiaceae bacterium BL-3]
MEAKMGYIDLIKLAKRAKKDDKEAFGRLIKI